MKVSYNITQNKFNASLNQETTEIKVSFKTGYYPFPSDLDLSNYYTKSETYSKGEVDEIISEIPVVDTSNLVPYTGATQDVNIGAYYFESSQGFKKAGGTSNQALTANGDVFDLNLKADLVDGKVPSSQLPSYVDDVLEFANLASFPSTGESGKIYIALDTNKTYRWSGSVYVIISESLALGETANTAYRGDRGKIAYDHSQTTGNPHGTTATDVDALKRDGSNANSNINIGEFQLKAGQIELDQTPTQLFGVGMIRWNDTDGTAEIRLKGNNVTLQLGQELVKRVVNKSGANLLESQYNVVKIVGATGQRLSIDLAQANNELNSATTLGMVTENINNNQEGFITYNGEVNGINTTGSLQGETWVDGDVLYLSPSVAGGVTKVKPTAPNHVVVVGYVEYAHITQGKIFIKIDNGYELDEIHNVNTSLSKTNPVDSDNLLIQDSTDSSIWKKISWANIKANLKTSFTHDILVANWTLVSGKYEAVISNAGILANSFVDVIPSNDNVDIVRNAQIYPSVLISAGSVKVYSKFLPSGTISVTVNVN